MHNQVSSVIQATGMVDTSFPSSRKTSIQTNKQTNIMHEDVFPGTLDNRKNFFEAHMIKVELRRHPGIQGTYLWSQRC